MQLTLIDVFIIGLYLATTIVIGVALKHRLSKKQVSHLLGGKTLPWRMLSGFVSVELIPIRCLMIVGILAALTFPTLLAGVSEGVDDSILPLYLFPLIVIVAGVAAIIATCKTGPEDEKIFKEFYGREYEDSK